MAATVETPVWDADSGLWTVDGGSTDGTRSDLSRPENVISSAPIRELIDAIAPSAAHDASRRANLRYRDFLTVALIAEDRRDVPGQLDLHPRSRR